MFLLRGDSVLLLRRSNTGFEDERFSVVAGHVEPGESVTSAALRETREEVGIELELAHLDVVGVMHRLSSEERIDFFLAARPGAQEPHNAEPDKCSELLWSPLTDLPSDTIPYVRSALENFEKGRWFEEFGWPEPAGKMHADEVATDVPLVRRLLAAQFPRWADLAIERVQSAGTDNAIYRLGDDMAVRLPRIHRATGQVDKEHEWLPRLAPLLPLTIPVPLEKGEPAEGYPWRWSVHPWLEGENATLERLADPCQAATDLAQFVAALQGIDSAGGPASGPSNFFRGVELSLRDAPTRAAIGKLHGSIDVDAVTAAWEAALEAPAWQGAPVWIHGDLQSGNLLAVGGQLSAVIDFGGLGVGDPACDLIVAWSLFSGEARAAFRAALSVDDATWERGRGWALSVALIALPYYVNTNPSIVRDARHMIDEVLSS